MTYANYREPGEFGEGATVRRAEPTIDYRVCGTAELAAANPNVMSYVKEREDEIERLQTENASLRHSSLVARLSHEQLNRFIQLFDRAGFKGHQVDTQAKMAVEELERLREALRKIAAYDDAAADAYLRATGSYRCFDEPKAVEMARGVLEGKTDG